MTRRDIFVSDGDQCPPYRFGLLTELEELGSGSCPRSHYAIVIGTKDLAELVAV